MVTLRDCKQVGMTNTFPPKKIIIADIQVDEEEELESITTTSIPGFILFQGSIVWVISTGAFYAMTSGGQWKSQGEGESSEGT
jgi:hypothetical protein